MKKSKIKALRKLASMLPKSVEYKEGGQYIKGSALSNDQKKAVMEKHSKVNPSSYYGTEKRGFVPINHVDRLKKAWTRNQEKGLVHYINWVDANNKKMNELNDTLKLEEVNSEVMALADKGAKGFWKRLIQFLLAFVTAFKPTENKELASV